MGTTIGIDESATYPHPPEEVWKLCGDPGEIAAWLPPVQKSWMEGDIRHAELAGGGVAREKIVSHQDSARRYDYEYLDGPMVLRAFTSRFAVEADGDSGSRIHWTATFEADDTEQGRQLEQAIAGMYSSGLANIAAVLDSSNGR